LIGLGVSIRVNSVLDSSGLGLTSLSRREPSSLSCLVEFGMEINHVAAPDFSDAAQDARAVDARRAVYERAAEVNRLRQSARVSAHGTTRRNDPDRFRVVNAPIARRLPDDRLKIHDFLSQLRAERHRAHRCFVLSVNSVATPNRRYDPN